MDDGSIETKQLFLREEIIKKGFDAQEFSDFLQEEKGEEKIDLEYWPMKDLKEAVVSFQESKMIKNIKTSKSKKRRNSSVSPKNRKKINNDNENSFGKTISFKNDSKNQIKKISEGNNCSQDDDDLNDINNQEEEEDETKIKCIKLADNEITKRDDLYVVIQLTEESKKKRNFNFI
jgi:hypothetical protein